MSNLFQETTVLLMIPMNFNITHISPLQSPTSLYNSQLTDQIHCLMPQYKQTSHTNSTVALKQLARQDDISLQQFNSDILYPRLGSVTNAMELIMVSILMNGNKISWNGV